SKNSKRRRQLCEVMLQSTSKGAMRVALGKLRRFTVLRKQRRAKGRVSGALLAQTQRGSMRIALTRWFAFRAEGQRTRARKQAAVALLMRGSSASRQRLAFRSWLHVLRLHKTARQRRQLCE